MEVTRETAHKLGMLLVGPSLVPPIHEAEYRRVFLAMSEERADGLVISDQPEHFTITNRQVIANLAKEYHLPIIGSYRHYAEAGALLSYGVDDVSLFRISATQVNQILKGASPGDMPVQQPTKLLLVVNAKTATALGLTIPQSVLLRADEVIE